jgi:dolichol-phosphate mannosyltransferase
MERAHTCVTLIPAYNEEKSIERVVRGALKYTDVCVIDDASVDSTAAILETIEDVHVIHHETKTHIPGCILDGMRYVLEQGYAFAITMDAGLSHDPDEIPCFIQHTNADLVLGCRIVHHDTPFYRRVLSKVGNLFYNICLDFPETLFGTRYRDMTSGFRMYSHRAMTVITASGLESASFDVILETVHILYTHHHRIEEVDISYRFSNSSLKAGVIMNCLHMCVKLLVRTMYRKAGRLWLSTTRASNKGLTPF